MNILNPSTQPYTRAYNIEVQPVPQVKDRTGVYANFCRIKPGESTLSHRHFEAEIFLVTAGKGLMTIGKESRVVAKGDLVQIPPFNEHQLINSGFEALEFVSVYSEDFEVSPVPSDAIVTAAPPTPNGPLHLGHLSGPYLAADIYARYLRMRGAKVLLETGTDDNQNYVFERALSLSASHADFRAQMRERIASGFANFDLSFDVFYEPSKDSAYQRRVQSFVERALEKGVLEIEAIDFPSCAKCEIHLVDGLIAGHCPRCEAESRGACENCGMVVPCTDLVKPSCSRCGSASTPQPTSVLTFNLSKYLPLIEKDLENLNLTPRLRELIQSVQQMKNLKIIASQPSATSHPSILTRDGQHAIHVWLEMAAQYESYALAKGSWIHSFGFDNAFYYLLYIPALLRAVHPEAKLPQIVLTNEFLQLDGKKFSTSRNHAIWADDFKANSNHLRFYLCLHRPQSRQSDFRLEDFERFSRELANRFASLREKTDCRQKLQSAKRDHQPLSSSYPSLEDGEITECNRATRDLEQLYANGNFRGAALRLLMLLDLVESSNNPEPLLRAFCQIATPIMPTVHTELNLKQVHPLWVKDWTQP